MHERSGVRRVNSWRLQFSVVRRCCTTSNTSIGRSCLITKRRVNRYTSRHMNEMSLHLLNKVTMEHLCGSAGQSHTVDGTWMRRRRDGSDERAGTERNTGLVGRFTGRAMGGTDE
jgi:hypothetical protein